MADAVVTRIKPSGALMSTYTHSRLVLAIVAAASLTVPASAIAATAPVNSGTQTGAAAQDTHQPYGTGTGRKVG
jgi:hypothetical protein